MLSRTADSVIGKPFIGPVYAEYCNERLSPQMSQRIVSASLDDPFRYPSSYGKLIGLGAWLEWGHQTYAGQISDYRKQLKLIPANDQLTNAEIVHAEAALNNVAANEPGARARCSVLNDARFCRTIQFGTYNSAHQQSSRSGGDCNRCAPVEGGNSSNDAREVHCGY